MKTHIEIDAKNLNHNLKLFHHLTKKKLMFVVKANGYGHGLKEVVQISKKLPFIGYFIVDSLEEALLVKKENVHQPILVVGWLDIGELKELVLNGFETLVSSEDHLRQINTVLKNVHTQVRVHIKVETGISRLGMNPERAIRTIRDSNNDYLKIVGVYSHFANIEDTTDPSYARIQMKRFRSVLSRVKGKSLLRHFSCSASALLFPETYLDMVRIGISAYGYWPSKQTYLSYLEKKGEAIDLKKVLSWYSQVAQIKHLAKNTPIGYGLTYKTLTPSRIAVIPVGYYDGFDRRLSNIAQVLIKGEMAPVRGRVCMNMFMAEVSHIRNLGIGDRVVLIGIEGQGKIDADTYADLIGSINYEILARINPLVPRMIVKQGI